MAIMPHPTIRPRGDVEAVINYTVTSKAALGNTDQVELKTGGPTEAWDAQTVVIRDMRQADKDFELDVHGFTLTRCHCEIKDFADHEHIMRVTEAATEEVLKRVYVGQQ